MQHPPAPNRLPQLTLERLDSDLARLAARCWQSQTPVAVVGSDVLTEIVGVAAAETLSYRPVAAGDSYGAPHDDWRQRWFRLQVPPATEQDRGRRHLIWRANGEYTVHRSGTAWAGLDCGHPSCPLPDAGGELVIEGCLWQTAIWGKPTPITSTGCRFEGAWIGVRDEAAWQLYHDTRVLVELVQHHYRNGPDGNLLEGGRHHFQPTLRTIAPLVRQLIERLRLVFAALDDHGVAAAQAVATQCYQDFPAAAWSGTVTLLGHSHLDLVWRWTEAATRRKWVHTSATVTGLMERYPEHTFINSQPWLLDQLAEDDPDLRQRVQARIDDGRWELEGMLAVESDVLLTGGETLVRCLVHGQRQITTARGKPAGVVWIPDVFGYSGCLPQLITLAGGRGFFTSKLTWNRVTPFPYTSFQWQGNDGSAVLAHLPPVGFNGDASLSSVVNALDDHRQADVHPAVLAPIGYGDGGGGPSEDHLERARRLADLAGVPRATWGTCEGFFDQLQQVREQLPRFRGELYLEAHRATPTSQSEHKRVFRAAERSLQTWEAVRCVTGGAPLPDQAWERVLLASFHDAIPGSSIGQVYAELNPQLEAVACDAATAALHELNGDHLNASLQDDDISVFNPLPVARQVVLERDAGGDEWPDALAIACPALGSMSMSVASAGEGVSPGPDPSWDGRQLIGTDTSVTFDEHGEVTQLVLDGEPVPLTDSPGLWLSADHPSHHDAWEVDSDDVGRGERLVMGLPTCRQRSLTAITIGQSVAIDGAAVGELSWRVVAGVSAVELRLSIDWQQDHRWLRWIMPTSYQGRLARFGAPFGAALRPQLPGSEQDSAMWEGAGSRWAAVTDEPAAHGLAIITEAKYGFAAHDGALSLSLLRAPSEPDPACDRGHHTLHWQCQAFRRHTTDSQPSTALAAETAYADVLPTTCAISGPAAWSELAGLVPSWAQPCQNGMILRAHDTAGEAGCAILTLSDTSVIPEAVDLLERPVTDVSITADGPGRWRVGYRAYQIISLRCRRP